MRYRIVMLLTIVLGALLQQFLPTWPLFGGIKPPILAALTLYYALRRNAGEMWLAVFAAALLQDGLDLGSFGPALIAFPVIGLLANRIRNEVFADGIFTQLFFGAVIGLFTTLIALFVYAVTGQRPLFFGLAVLRLVSSVLLGMATLPVVSQIVNRLEVFIPERRGYGWQ
ncbi:MAG: hypothetical protein HKP10_01515 [Kiritimatiellales bacterium]|nr:hypothetical protein [Pontiella sp.]NNJ69949.1 hypothetical protein [Kiritimatiellales bacterium]